MSISYRDLYPLTRNTPSMEYIANMKIYLEEKICRGELFYFDGVHEIYYCDAVRYLENILNGNIEIPDSVTKRVDETRSLDTVVSELRYRDAHQLLPDDIDCCSCDLVEMDVDYTDYDHTYRKIDEPTQISICLHDTLDVSVTELRRRNYTDMTTSVRLSNMVSVTRCSQLISNTQ